MLKKLFLVSYSGKWIQFMKITGIHYGLVANLNLLPSYIFAQKKVLYVSEL